MHHFCLSEELITSRNSFRDLCIKNHYAIYLIYLCSQKYPLVFLNKKHCSKIKCLMPYMKFLTYLPLLKECITFHVLSQALMPCYEALLKQLCVDRLASGADEFCR